MQEVTLSGLAHNASCVDWRFVGGSHTHSSLDASGAPGSSAKEVQAELVVECDVDTVTSMEATQKRLLLQITAVLA